MIKMCGIFVLEALNEACCKLSIDVTGHAFGKTAVFEGTIPVRGVTFT